MQFLKSYWGNEMECSVFKDAIVKKLLGKRNGIYFIV